MSNQETLDEIENILKITGASEEKVSALCKDLTQSNSLCKQLKDNLKELRQLGSKNATELEDNQHLKTNIKKFTEELVEDAERLTNEELLRQNEEMIDERSNKYKDVHMTLKQQLESLEKEETDIIKKRELEAKVLLAENEELEAEIKKLILEEQLKEHYVKNESAIFDEENRLERLIEFQENVKLIKNEIEGLSTLLKEKGRLGIKLESDGEATILEMDQRIGESEIEVKDTRSSITNRRLNIDEVTSKIETLENQIENKEEECKNYRNEITNTETNVTTSENNFNKDTIGKEKLFSESEEKYEQQKEFKEQLEVETRALKYKIEAQQECVNQILEYLATHKTDPTVSAELQDKQVKRGNLKTTHQQLKEDFDKRILEMEDELKRLQQEVEARTRTNKKVQENTDSLVSELRQLESGLEETNTEIEQRNRQIEELDGELENLHHKVAHAKAGKSKNKNRNIQDSKASSTSSGQKEEKPHDWDSDNSIEDRRLSDFIKQKIKMEKMRTVNRK